MASILTLAVGLPIGAGISYLLEEPHPCWPCGRDNLNLNWCCSRFCCCELQHLLHPLQQLLRHENGGSISSFLQRRIHAYTILTWSGFAVFIYLLWTRSDGMAFVDPHAAETAHGLAEGLAMGFISGMLLGCGLMGSILNYQQMRAGDRQHGEIQNSDLAIQLITNDEEEST